MATTISLTPEMTQLIDYAIEHRASDLHLIAEAPPSIRVDSHLVAIDAPPLTEEIVNKILTDFIGPARQQVMKEGRGEVDFSFGYRDLRFRCNIFIQRGSMAASIRLLPNQTQDLDALGVPQIVGKLVERNQGLFVVAGPTGHGKSTTLAAVISQISATRRGHIITIEDPIEYIFPHKKSIVSQREIGTDTPSFGAALRSALREDPDVVLIGEMRDHETMEAALQLAETGHLVLTTLHTNSAAQTADRIIDVFPPHQQAQVRSQLSQVLIGVVSQRLLPRVQGGRVLATEILVATPAVRAIIRDGKTHQLPNLIQTSAAEGMVGMDKTLAELVTRGEVSIDDALAWSLDPKALKMMIY